MRQFDIYENPTSTTRSFAPYLIVLSSHHLIGLDDVIVAPLVNDSLKAVSALEIEIDVDGQRLVLVMTELSSMAAQRLKRIIASAAAYEDDIRRALDRLFTGF